MALVCECVFVELWVGAITMTSVCIKLHIIVIRILINITFGFSVTANEQSFVFSPSLFLSLGGSLFYCVIIFIIQKYDLTCVIVYKYNMYVRRRHSHRVSYVLHRRTILRDTDCRQHFISDLYMAPYYSMFITQYTILSVQVDLEKPRVFDFWCRAHIDSIYLFLNCCRDSYVRTMLGAIFIWFWIFWCLANEVIISNGGFFIDWSTNKIVLRVFDDGYDEKNASKNMVPQAIQAQSSQSRIVNTS